MSNYRFTFVIERDEDGRFVASCPALQGCCTESETEAEVRASIAEVIQAHVELRLERGELVGTEVGADTIHIAV
jgi:predicted RNase H-like HicB family nuclease